MNDATKKRVYPRAFTERQLDKVGVDLINEYDRILRCQNCYRTWIFGILPEGKFPRGYWKCPDGCHDE